MLLSILYLLLSRFLGLARHSDDLAKDIEITVLRHQLQVLRRLVGSRGTAGRAAMALE